VLNTLKALDLNKEFNEVCCFCFTKQLVFAGYQDGLVAVYSIHE
jgi:cytochrome c oxidase assembly protein Cox11